MVKNYVPSVGVLPFGKMGNGKSTLGNCLLGLSPNESSAFTEGMGAVGVTTAIQRKTRNGLTFWDVPGLGDPRVDDQEFAQNFIKTFKADLQRGETLNCVIVVKKSNDFRVDTDMGVYTTVLTAIMGADPNFDTSKLVLGLTFCEHHKVTDAQIKQFWEALFMASGISKYHTPPPASRTIRHQRSSTQEDMHRQLAPLVGGMKKVKKIRTDLKKLKSVVDCYMVDAWPGVKAAYAKKSKGCCFLVGQSVVTMGKAGPETIQIEDVQVGDHVLCYDPATRKQFYDKVIYTNDHAMFREDRIAVETFTVRTTEGQVHKLALTPNHNAMVLEKPSGVVLPKAAHDVRLGDSMLITASSGGVQVGKVLKRELTSVAQQQVFAVHTLSSHIVVNGVVASCYSAELGWKYKLALKFFGQICPHYMTAVGRQGEAYLNHTGEATCEHNWLAIAASKSSGLLILLTLLLALANSPSATWGIVFCGLLARECTLRSAKDESTAF